MGKTGGMGNWFPMVITRVDLRGPEYTVEVKRVYNCFDAWVALEVDLYALEDDKWVLIDNREFCQLRL